MDRKAVSRYIPHNFDPSKLSSQTTRRRPASTITLQMPMTVRCDGCKGLLARNTKVNARKETLKEKYMGRIDQFRFFVQCTDCGAQITFRSNPKETRYDLESGGVDLTKRNRTESEAKTPEANPDQPASTLETLEARAHETRRRMKQIDQLELMRAQSVELGKVTNEDRLRVVEEAEAAKEGGGTRQTSRRRRRPLRHGAGQRTGQSGCRE